jgi:hypothetical protein
MRLRRESQWPLLVPRSHETVNPGLDADNPFAPPRRTLLLKIHLVGTKENTLLWFL